jgi:competence protein ComEA
MDSPAPVPPDPPAPATPVSGSARLGWRGSIAARLRLGAGAVVVLLLLALAVAVLVSLLTPTGASATLERPAAEGGPSRGSSATLGANHSPAAGTDPRSLSAAEGATGTPGPVDRPVLVHVLGSVAVPGLFELPVGARVVDAIAAAGGLAPAADPARVNLARTVSDGEQLYVPALGEVAPLAAATPGAAGPSSDSTAAGAILDLNTATVTDLDTLPRIGPQLAQRIVEWRSANGRFGAPEDLLEVPGIGDRTFEGLRERVTV